MSDGASSGRKKGAGLAVARVAALAFSAGVVATLMMRASGGCADRAEIGADPTKTAPDPPPPSTEQAAESAKTGKPGKGEYLMGTKAPSHPLDDEAADTASAAPAQAATQPAPPPRFLPATKAASPVFEGPKNPPPSQAPQAPAQQKNAP